MHRRQAFACPTTPHPSPRPSRHAQFTGRLCGGHASRAHAWRTAIPSRERAFFVTLQAQYIRADGTAKGTDLERNSDEFPRMGGGQPRQGGHAQPRGSSVARVNTEGALSCC